VLARRDPASRYVPLYFHVDKLMRTLKLLVVLVLLSGCGWEKVELERFWSHRFEVQNDISYGTDPAQKLDVYRQGSHIGEFTYFEIDPNPRPTLIFIHGGGWLGGKRADGLPLLLPFVEKGWHVVNIEYRLGAGTAPAAVDDAMCALKWVVDNAEAYGFDTSKIVVSGGSAGGHLALTTGILGSREGNPCYPGSYFKVAAVVNWFGITNIVSLEDYLNESLPENNYVRMWAGDVDRIADLSNDVSPEIIVDSGSPPIITIQGESDTIVPFTQATTFHKRLDELGVVNELVSFPEGSHFGFSDEEFQVAFRSIFAFLGGLGIQN